MSTDLPAPAQSPEPAGPADKGQRSGEGSATALQALIRKRRQVESQEGTQPPKPQPQPPLP